MKQTHLYLFLLCTFFTVTAEITRDYLDDEAEIGFFDVDSDNAFTVDDSDIKVDCPGLSVFDVVDLATNPVNEIMIQNTLQLQLYNFTHPTVIRPLQDDPVLMLGRIEPEDCGCNRFSTKLFYKEMRKSYLTPCSPFLSSYLAIFTDPELISEIDRLSELFGPDLDIPAVFPLFENIKLEERRTGFMFGYQHRHCNWEFKALIPLYYFEHNFFLTEREQRAIQNDPFFKRIQENTEPDETVVEAFAMAHLVNDSFGFGDLRSIVTYDIITNDCLTVALGVELDLPTSVVIADHIIGGIDCITGQKISACPSQPPFDLYGIMCLAQEHPKAAQQVGLDFAVGALNRLTEILAQAPLGTRRVEIAGTLEWFVELEECVTWRNKFRMAYLTPTNETRFLRNTKNPADFDRDYANPALADENNKFLSDQIVLFFYPPVVTVHSHPGIVLQYTTGFTVQRECYRLDFGYDYWHQARESFKVVSAPVPVDCCEGIKPSATQNKLWAIFSVDKSDPCRDWRFGFFGDMTVASKGIGKDWCAGVDISMLF